MRFELLPGHRFDTVGVAPLIEGINFGGLIADKAFDSNHTLVWWARNSFDSKKAPSP